MATNLLTIACFLASRRAPTAIVTDRTVGMATIGHRQHQGELQQSEDRVAAINCNTDDKATMTTTSMIR